MKPYCGVTATIIMAVCLPAAENGHSAENAPEIVKGAIVGDAFFVGFGPKTSAWLSVDASLDLLTWTTLASVATTNSVTEFVDEAGAMVSHRFYRLRQPGTSVDEAEDRWSEHASADYQFHLQRVRSSPGPSVLDADVSVHAGEKQVSNARAAGEPLILQPDPSDFPTVPELFELLRKAQQSGCWRVAVIYDEAHGFPSWCVVERLASGFNPKQIDSYRISGLTFKPND